MGLKLDEDTGKTPLSEDEKEGLRISTITTRAELDEFEQLNIEKAMAWSMRKKAGAREILSQTFVSELHRRMFDDVWVWAGQFRTTNKNLGVDKSQIRIELKKLVDDCLYWIEKDTYSGDEIAVRFSHRIVAVHCFPNGNGRHARLIGDNLAGSLGLPFFTWGSVGLKSKREARSRYLSALRLAGQNDYSMLLKFARE